MMIPARTAGRTIQYSALSICLFFSSIFLFIARRFSSARLS
ncbi:hypothetical protein EVA_21942 [gut metagenome]|uniref:Uncharacterized protein n=1 Tax=gut metagenome TaxID=749906 RepID=J9F646_9ZZZZ